MFLGRGYSHDSITAAMPFHASRTPEEHALCMLLQCFETPEDLVKSELLECRSHVYSQLRRSLAHKCEL